MKIFLNNEFIDAERARVSPFDRGLLYGQGVFETMRTIRGIVPYFNAHYSRLKKSASFAGIDFPLSAGALKRIIKKLTGVNSIADAYVRVTLTAGDNGPHGTLLKSEHPKKYTLLVFAQKCATPSKSMYKNGVSLWFGNSRCREAQTPRHKTTSYLENLLARRTAQLKNCFDTILFDERGCVSECATSNIFWLKNDIIITPSLKCPVLPGVTRKAVIDIAKKCRITVKEKDNANLAEVAGADEVFITNSIIGILPVRKVIRRKIAGKIPGKITGTLMKKYETNIP